MKKNLLILGAGTAGTIMANHLRKKVDLNQWSIKIVDQDPNHYYQPGFLFMPFGLYADEDVVRPKRRLVGGMVEYVEAAIDRVDPDADQVHLQDGTVLDYDILIIATGTRPNPEETEGMTGSGWRKDVFEFYTYEGARALREQMAKWKGGKLVVHICEMPIKCPTMCTFGGPNLEILFVTSATFSMTDDEIAEEPQAGGLFAIHGLGARGVPEPTFGR